MKEGDMDELLCKAAENYDVNVNRAADWNAVYNAVHTPESPEPEKKPRRRRRVFWWLLLIPLGWLVNVEYNKFKQTSSKKETNTTNTINQKANTLQHDSIENKATSSNSTNNNMSEKDIVSGNSQNNRKALFNKTFQQAKISQPQQQNNFFENNNSLSPAQQSISIKAGNSLQNKTIDADKSLNSITDSLTGKPNNVPALSHTDSGQRQNNTAKTSAASIKKPTPNSHYLYGGIMAGTDLSLIKFQALRPPGYSLGLLVGYKFNKLSIESGFNYTKKNYYTKGKYFNKNSIDYFYDAEILKVDGYCSMYEIPLNIKYNLSEQKKHVWYALAGLSTYLMNKEFYNYDYIKYGEQRSGSRSYYHAAQNWFSVLNLSVGYELRAGLKTNLRIEPYYKAPLNGLGTGKLSIASFGINAGITRRIP